MCVYIHISTTWQWFLRPCLTWHMLCSCCPAGKMPTVVSPELYRARFCEAMDKYFLMVPDHWTGLGVNCWVVELLQDATVDNLQWLETLYIYIYKKMNKALLLLDSRKHMGKCRNKFRMETFSSTCSQKHSRKLHQCAHFSLLEMPRVLKWPLRTVVLKWINKLDIFNAVHVFIYK